MFGRSDADAAFGLAYAHAEDDFGQLQRSVLMARGELAAHAGPGAAPLDYAVQLLRVWQTVLQRFACIRLVISDGLILKKVSGWRR